MAGRKLSNNRKAVEMREYYLRNKDAQIERAKDWQARARVQIQEMFAEFRARGCVLCGETHPACLEAHHRVPDDKEYRLWEWRHRGLGPDKVRAELAKCVCVCSNCHRKLHYGTDFSTRGPRKDFKPQWRNKKKSD